jgi:hypothetical protein
MKEVINNTQVLADTGLRIVHFVPTDRHEKGFTVAFRPTNKPVVEISTSICKNGDTFSKKMGTRTAIENFQKGRTILLPYNKLKGVIPSLKDLLWVVL